MKHLILILALLCPAQLGGADRSYAPAVKAQASDGPKLVLPSEIKGEVADFITVPAETDGQHVRWVALDTGLKLFPVHLLKDSRTAVVTAAKPGRFRLLAYTAKGDTPSEPAICVVIIGTPGPDPVPPPGPDPVPPPGPAPIPAPGFRVLILYETADLGKLPRQQAAVLTSQIIRDYLNSKCVMGPDGKTRDWRVWDQHTDVSGETPLWQTVMKRPRSKVPWIVISTGTGGYEGPLPETISETYALLQRYGG